MRVSRALKKTITWRCISMVVLIIFGYLFTGSVAISGAIAIVHQAVVTVLYYLHEIAWSRGKKCSRKRSS